MYFVYYMLISIIKCYYILHGFFFHFWDYKKLVIFFLIEKFVERTLEKINSNKFPNFFGEKTTIFSPKNTEIYVYL
jgi:hypothetical protein